MILKSIIVDDEQSAIDVLEEYITRIASVELVGSFRNPTDALAFLAKTPVDLVLLDINMPGISGLQFPGLMDQPPLIIFTTAYQQYAVESYEQNAVDYLLKPIAFDRFVKAIQRALSLKTAQTKETNDQPSPNASDQLLFIKSGPKMHRVRPADIIYLEKDGHYVTFHTTEGKILSRLSMNQVFDFLSETEFVQVHKSFIVGLRHIETILRNELIIGERKIPIGTTFREKLNEKIRQFGQ